MSMQTIPPSRLSPCHPQAPFVCFADIFPANGEIYPLHKGGFYAPYNNFTNYDAIICKREKIILLEKEKQTNRSCLVRDYLKGSYPAYKGGRKFVCENITVSNGHNSSKLKYATHANGNILLTVYKNIAEMSTRFKPYAESKHPVTKQIYRCPCCQQWVAPMSLRGAQ